LVLFSLLLGFTYSCDDTLTPKDFDDIEPYVAELTVNPSNITFDQVLDGQKDTTLNLNLSVKAFNLPQGSTPFYSIFVNSEEIPSIQGLFQNARADNLYNADVQISTNTIDFNSYTLLVTPSTEAISQNYAQAIIKQTGVPINAPEILEVNNPEEVEIPSGSNTTTVLFTAKVRDADGQSNIDKVLLNFRNEDGTLLGASPFEMFDDGASSSGDETAADSVFSTTFTINSSNTPNNRTALYWAIDKSGLSSDTLETPFNLVDNE
tara:strand:+ start:274 stop:1065 length:792 start_codon:yes stop_codon:yes gene_type:complete